MSVIVVKSQTCTLLSNACACMCARSLERYESYVTGNSERQSIICRHLYAYKLLLTVK